jgi:hypothetical protein
MQNVVDRLKNLVRDLKVNPVEPSLVMSCYYFALTFEVTLSTEKSLHPFASFAFFAIALVTPVEPSLVTSCYYFALTFELMVSPEKSLHPSFAIP